MTTEKKPRKKRIVKLVSFDDVRKNVIMSKVETIERKEEGRTISASELPRSSHIIRMEKYVAKLHDVKLCIVAIRKLDKAWEAFVGYPDIRDLKAEYKNEEYWETYEWCCENVHDVQQVKMMGEKLSKDHALILFPNWAKFDYFK